MRVGALAAAALACCCGICLPPVVTASEAPTEGRRLHFYTYTDLIPHPGICALAEASTELGFVLRVIGLSKRPGFILVHSHSPTLKFLMLEEVVSYDLNTGKIAADDLMIFADGHDVLLQLSIAELLRAYARFPGSPYLISGEKNCWPWPHSDPSHGEWDPGMAIPADATFQVHKWLQVRAVDFCRAIPQKGPYRYPNIGLSMGPVSRFLEVLRRNNRIVLDEDVNDQGAMWLVILRHAEELNIEIDQNAEVFLNMLQYTPGDLEREPCGADWFAPRAGPAAPSARAGVAAEEPSPVSAPDVSLTSFGAYCVGGTDVQAAPDCQDAAAALGIRWGGVFDGPGDHRSCLHADDGRDAVFFNAADVRLASPAPPNRNYRSLCHTPPHARGSPGGPAGGQLPSGAAAGAAGDTAARRRPPRNRLTNTTPALVHFNGPAHEDEVWVQCYHAWTAEFRARGRDHALYDVDHNVVISTDDVCDYSFYNISSYHAHPLHAGMTEFYKGLYSMPVDPGLLAWRNSSAVDTTRFGKEQELHADRPLLQKALLFDIPDRQQS